ncbi:linear amide C-N hydrolase [Pseudomonas chlororaphis]|uniref:Choloylglycine hydrolase family protein n=1 Tax=Pseudomonas chlororaphis O6 TaxID=1037915 RepID=A0AB33WJ78_9PSED|nr:linear amide C-N hydrolase [Pseudomonas chlororaphis]EIM13317.1 choloylglycine hydrolase family protein [Pseudomonas chlororaphis O6]
MHPITSKQSTSLLQPRSPLLHALKYIAIKPLCLAVTLAGLSLPADACTRAVFIGQDNLVLTGRNMDWVEDLGSNIWALPAGMKRDSGAGTHSLSWVAKYGSVAVSGYDLATTDGMNEKGLVANLLYLTGADFGEPTRDKPQMSVSLWLQYVLDNFDSVTEAVEAMQQEPFTIAAPTLPNGKASTLHLSISDSSGDSAIFEYVAGKLKVHHGKQYSVMTNEPAYDEQLAINDYWQRIGGLTFLPGTGTGADRFVRTSFLLNAIPRQPAEQYLRAVPDRSFANQAVASMMGVMRSVSVPLGISTPDRPNLSSTLWRTVADQKNRVYYFDSATRPNTFWVSLDKLDLKEGSPARRLLLADGEVYSGEAAGHFQEHRLFQFLQAAGHE